MAFDGFMLAAVVRELRTHSVGAYIEKIYMPTCDEVILQTRNGGETRNILINTGSGNPRICFTELKKDNPRTPLMFCMLLRKKLGSGRLFEIEQTELDRVVRLGFECRDEMGFSGKKYLIAEIMGKYGNLILADGDMKITAARRNVDFTMSALRQVLPGMKYEAPPSQGRKNPAKETKEGFLSGFSRAPGGMRADKYMVGAYMGMGSTLAGEIIYRATGKDCVSVSECDGEKVFEELEKVTGMIKTGNFRPCAVFLDSNPVEYGFLRLTRYGEKNIREYDSLSLMLDAFYGERDRERKIRNAAGDLIKIISRVKNRITKKISLQTDELAECEKADEYRRRADVITCGIREIRKGSERVLLRDYSRPKDDGGFEMTEVVLDASLSPSENAAKLYKKYRKLKRAKAELEKQIEAGKEEIRYMESVYDSLARSETLDDLSAVREELSRLGYVSRGKKDVPKANTVKYERNPLKFKTQGGFTLLCGKNNIQNDFITHRVAGKNDYWFHVKNSPGSHVILLCGGEEPREADMTEAAAVAACHSGHAEGELVAVDYTRVKNVKKPSGARPGFVTYVQNKTAYVKVSREETEKMRTEEN